MALETNQNFVIRVYGIFMDDDSILLSDEFQLDMKMTKFPGGGLNYGEGPIDCLKRECIEEFGQEVEVIDHFYTTDFYQEALFYKNYQLISIYYLAKFKDTIKFKISQKPFDFKELKNGNQSFRWAKIASLSEHDLTFPIDKKVFNLIKSRFIK